MTYEFTPAMPHGKIDEVFPGVYVVTGTTRPNFEGLDWQFSRNMTIVKEGEALTLVNTVRLDDDGLAALDALGKVSHVVRIGAFHGFDDAFYVDRYGAKLWALPQMEHESGLPTDCPLKVGGEMPFSDASLFVFETSKTAEALLLVARAGGIAISCDSLQNWEQADEYFDEGSAERMGHFGFFRVANVGPGWMRFAEPQKSDFDRVLEAPFQHLLSAHGTPLRDVAKEKLAETFAALAEK